MKNKIKLQPGVWCDLNILVRNDGAYLVQMRKMADGSKEFKDIKILDIDVNDDNEATRLAKCFHDKIINNYE